MDYADGVELWKYQWDLLHNPEEVRQDEVMTADKPNEVRALVELLRYAYACGKSIKLKKKEPSTRNIILGDNIELVYLIKIPSV